MDQALSSFALLALCARMAGHADQYQRIAQHVTPLLDWNTLPGQAEIHGIAPLVNQHLQAAAVAIPTSAQQQLRGYAMHYAHQSQVQLQVLSEILACYQAQGIPALVLKGAALSALIYATPGLRPMRDLDLLVPAYAAERAQALLATVGFTLPPTPMHGLGPDHHHLAATKRKHQGISVSVELHHRLNLEEAGRPTRRFEEFSERAQPFSINGVAALALGKEDMLWHVYRHAFGMPLTYEPLRLIWVADLVSLVEAWLDQLDWERVRRVYPAAYRSLPMLHHLTPWSERAIERLQLRVAPPPRGIGIRFDGWPRYTLAEQRPKGLRRSVWDSVFPAPWWLRLRYGYGPALTDYWRAWSAHQRMLWPLVAKRAGLHLRHHSQHHWRRLRQRIQGHLRTLRSKAERV